MTFRKIISRLKYAETYNDIDSYRQEIIELMPFVDRMVGYNQYNTAHQYDLWSHSVHTVLNLPRGMDDDMLYLAALLHDIGKPDCQCDGKRPEDVNKHYYGHPERSKEIVQDIIIPSLEKKGVIFSEDEIARLLYYVEYHDDWISLRIKHLRRHLKLVSFDTFKKLMVLEMADAKAHIMIPIIEERIDICSKWAGDYGREKYLWLLKESSVGRKLNMNSNRIFELFYEIYNSEDEMLLNMFCSSLISADSLVDREACIKAKKLLTTFESFLERQECTDKKERFREFCKSAYEIIERELSYVKDIK